MGGVSDGRPPRGVVLAVDIGLIVIVLAWGLHVHGTESSDLLARGLRTISPFVLGWAVCAPVLGAYRATARSRLTRALSGIAGAWLGACLIGAAVRASPLVPGEAPGIFIAVVFGVGAAVLLPWRALVYLSSRA